MDLFLCSISQSCLGGGGAPVAAAPGAVAATGGGGEAAPKEEEKEEEEESEDEVIISALSCYIHASIRIWDSVFSTKELSLLQFRNTVIMSQIDVTLRYKRRTPDFDFVILRLRCLTNQSFNLYRISRMNQAHPIYAEIRRQLLQTHCDDPWDTEQWWQAFVFTVKLLFISIDCSESSFIMVRVIQSFQRAMICYSSFSKSLYVAPGLRSHHMWC